MTLCPWEAAMIATRSLGLEQSQGGSLLRYFSLDEADGPNAFYSLESPPGNPTDSVSFYVGSQSKREVLLTQTGRSQSPVFILLSTV